MKFAVPQSTGPGAIVASNTTYTSGSITITGVGGGVTVSSNTGQRVDISVAAQSVQVVQSALAASNTTYTSGLVTITGVGGGITVSSNTGQRIDLSVAAQSVQVVQSAIAASNTTYTSGAVTITGVGGGVTVSSNTGQRVDISVAAQSVQVVQSALAASNTTYTSGAVLLTGSNMVTVKSSGAGQTVIIDATQSVQTQNLVDVTLSGNTSGALALISSGTLTLAGGNNITLSQAGNAITISGAAAGGAQTAISGIAASNTTYTSGTVVFTGSNMITVKSSGAGQTVILDATQSVQVVQSAIAASNTTYTSGSVLFSGVGGGVTVSSNTGQRVDISVAAPVNFSAGVSTGGNTQGNTGISGTRLVLVGTSNITLSQNTDANGATISISGANGGAGGGVAIAASNTTYTSGTAVFSASDGSRSAISIASVGAQSVIVSDAGPTLAYWGRGFPIGTMNNNPIIPGTILSVFPLVPHGGNRFEGKMRAEIFRAFISHSQNQTSSISAALSSSMFVFVYTRTSDSLSLLNSASMSFGNSAANANNTSNWHGVRMQDVLSSAWSAAPDFVYGGEYYIGVQMRTHITQGLGSARWVALNSTVAMGISGFVGSASNNSQHYVPYWGAITLTATNHIRTTIAQTDLVAASDIGGGVSTPPTSPYIVLYGDTKIA